MVSGAVFINGRFLSKPITGTQRFAWEMVVALDALLAEQNTGIDVKIIAPPGTVAPEGLLRISCEACGNLKGHAWEQWDLFRRTRKGVLVNFCNAGPVLHPKALTVIHDAAVYRMPGNYSLAYRSFHRLLGRLLARRSALATVSDFSRKELVDVLGVKAGDIALLPNGHEHILRHRPETQILDRLSLRDRPYFLFVGTPAPNKNLKRAIEAFAKLRRPDAAFVIVGATESKVYGGNILEKPDNVLMPGRLTDGEIAALYGQAAALCFPSLYEGFGIPPLEAMALRCPVVASRLPPVEDVCSDAALYFNPLDIGDMAARMQDILASPERRDELKRKSAGRYPLFSWKNGAARLLEILAPMAGRAMP
jgi:glycosyltransferase involved in cell wall biosynthesis